MRAAALGGTSVAMKPFGFSPTLCVEDERQQVILSFPPGNSVNLFPWLIFINSLFFLHASCDILLHICIPSVNCWVRSKWGGIKSPKGLKAGSKCHGVEVMLPQELPWAPWSQTLHPGDKLGWKGDRLGEERSSLAHRELCLGGCIPGNRLPHCWVKGRADVCWD